MNRCRCPRALKFRAESSNLFLRASIQSCRAASIRHATTGIICQRCAATHLGKHLCKPLESAPHPAVHARAGQNAAHASKHGKEAERGTLADHGSRHGAGRQPGALAGGEVPGAGAVRAGGRRVGRRSHGSLELRRSVFACGALRRLAAAMGHPLRRAVGRQLGPRAKRRASAARAAGGGAAGGAGRRLGSVAGGPVERRRVRRTATVSRRALAGHEPFAARRVGARNGTQGAERRHARGAHPRLWLEPRRRRQVLCRRGLRIAPAGPSRSGQRAPPCHADPGHGPGGHPVAGARDAFARTVSHRRRRANQRLPLRGRTGGQPRRGATRSPGERTGGALPVARRNLT